jgi:hypothetical protein
MKVTTRFVGLVLMLAVATLCAGCGVLLVGAAAGAGAGTIAWIKGELRSTEGVPFDKAVLASQAGLKDMGYGTPAKEMEAGDVKFITYAGGKKIQVTLVKVSATATEIHIRVGTFGDQELSRQILAKIQAHLSS